MLIELSPLLTATLDALGWLVVHLVVAWAFTRMPVRWFDARRFPFGTRRWERNGRAYERRLAVRKWKDLLPDAAGWFTGGFPKRKLDCADPVYLDRFVRETCRGEMAHWVQMAFAPVFFIWNPLWAQIVITVYAVLANAPCIVVQRYNRIRLLRVSARRRPL